MSEDQRPRWSAATDLDHADGLLLGVREAGELLADEDRLAGRIRRVHQCRRAVAHRARQLACAVELQTRKGEISLADRVRRGEGQQTHVARKLGVDRVQGEVDHGSVPADVEHRVVVGRADVAQLLRVCELGYDGFILQELDAAFVRKGLSIRIVSRGATGADGSVLRTLTLDSSTGGFGPAGAAKSIS